MRRRAKASSAIAVTWALALCLCASPALAASKGVTGFFGGNGALGGQFGSVEGLAINQSGTGGAAPGDVYVASNGDGRVQQFSSTGAFKRAFGLNVGGAGVNVCTVAASCTKGTRNATAGSISATSIAIEQATGNVYLTSNTGKRIDVFSATGAFEGAFGWNVNASAPAEELQFCTTVTGCKTAVGGPAPGQFGIVESEGVPGGVSVSPLNGHIVVSDTGNRRLDEFVPTLESGVVTGASFVRGYGWGAADGANEFQICTTTCHVPAATGAAIGQFGKSYPFRSAAVDSTGKVYASDAPNQRVQTFSATATPLGAFAQAQLGASTGRTAGGKLAVDPANDHILGITDCGAETECRVLELDSGEVLLETYLANAGLKDIQGIAVGPNGDIYLATNHGPGAQEDKNGNPIGGEIGALILSSSPPVPPHVTIEPVSTFTGTTATFAGHVNPESAFPVGYHFEYSADGSNWAKAPVKDVQLPGGNAEHAVSVEVEGLEALTEYQVRLVATKSFGAGSAMAEASFETTDAPPLASATTVSRIRDTSAILEGEVNPENQTTEYAFEYVDQAGFEASGFAGAASVPAPPGSLSGGEAVAVEEHLAGLAPATTYHVRLTASNATGPTSGEENAFTTYLSHGEGLPDDRAYEQATPLDKNGGNINGSRNKIQAASDGGAITFYALSGASGGTGSQDIPFFLATRSADGWLSGGMMPPAATGPNGRVLGWSEDLSSTYSSNAIPGSGGAVYQQDNATQALRTIAQGSPGAVGLSGSGSSFAGTSDGGAQVLFETQAKLLPAAIEGKSNVYLWDEASGEVSLASVLNDGLSPAEGAFAGPYDWFFQNGGTNRGGAAATYYTQAQHAISKDGSAVYFTAAGSGKLYLRRNPTEAQSPLQEGECTDPDLACTVEASASARTAGGGPGGTDALGPKPKAFMAATPDGSKAFFTSAEQLTNDANTGPEPSIARASLEGTGIEAGFLPAVATGIAVDGAHVYWANPGANAIGRANLDGTGREPAFINGANSPQDVAVDAGRIYWTNAASGADGAGTIGRANLDGTEANQSFIAGANNPIGIAVDSEHLYWANSGNASSSVTARRIARANLDGSGVNQAFINSGALATPRGVAVDSGHVYYSVGNAIGRANLDGTSVNNSFIKNAKEPKGVAVDGAHIYWVNASTSAIGRANLDGTEPNQALAASSGAPSDVALDASHLYWSSANLGDKGNDLYRYDAGSQELTDLSPDPLDPNGAEVLGVLGASDDGSHVYFAANGVLTNVANPEGEAAALGNCKGKENKSEGTCNLYLWHEGAIDFIARLDLSGGITRADTMNWRPADASPDNGPLGYERTSRVSADGHTLLFRSQRSLTGYDNEVGSGECIPEAASAVCPELYRYDTEEGLACVSCNPTGAAPIGGPALRNIKPAFGPPEPSPTITRNLSADGSRVFFETPDPLVVGDTNGDEGCPRVLKAGGVTARTCQDVYEWEANGSGSCESDEENGGCLYLLSTGTSHDPSYFADASLSGDDAFFFTSQQLVAQDKDELIDIYDARAGGGIASQSRVEPVPCEGEACKAGATTPPAAQSPGTASFAGPGNPVAKHRKPHRKRRHGKRHRKHRSKSHRQARSHR